MLHSARWVPQAQHATFVCALASAPLAYLWDHQVSGRPLLPGAAFFELAATAAAALCAGHHAALALLGAAIPAPLVLPLTGSSRELAGALHVTVSVAAARLEVASLSTAGGRPAVHLAAGICAVAAAAPQRAVASAGVTKALLPTLPALPAQPAAAASAAAAAAAYGCVAAPSHDASVHALSPAVLDNCLQLGAAAPKDQLFIPAGLKALVIPARAAPRSSHQAVARPVPGVAQQGATFTNYSLCASSGAAACQIDSLEARPLAGAGRRAAAAAAKEGELQDQLMYQVDWLLHSVAGAATVTAAGSEARGGLRLAASAGAGAAVAAATAVAQGAAAGGLHSLSLLTGGLETGQGLQPVAASSAVAVPAAGLWGLARTLALELPAYTIAATDLATGVPGSSRRPVLLATPTSQPSPPALIDASPYGCSVRGAAVAAASLVPSAAKPALPPFRLFPKPRGALQNLQPEVLPSALLAPGRVFVAVKAVGVNFRDVLNVLGMYPGDPGPPGGDCAGVVVGVGPGVTHLQPGSISAKCFEWMHAESHAEALQRGAHT
jgi:hypothetical protein